MEGQDKHRFRPAGGRWKRLTRKRRAPPSGRWRTAPSVLASGV